MIKFVGLLLVFLSAVLFGAYRSYLLTLRVKLLAKMTESLCCLKEQIGCGGGELRSILPLCFTDNRCVTVDTDGIRISYNGFSEADKKILEDFFALLGSADSRTECERIERCVALLSHQHSSAQEELEQKGRLWRIGGVCVGTAICIFLI